MENLHGRTDGGGCASGKDGGVGVSGCDGGGYATGKDGGGGGGRDAIEVDARVNVSVRAAKDTMATRRF